MRDDALMFLQGLFQSPQATDGLQNVSTADIRPQDLPLRWQVEWEERAAIREYCGEMSRADAEAAALAETVRLMRLTGN